MSVFSELVVAVLMTFLGIVVIVIPAYIVILTLFNAYSAPKATERRTNIFDRRITQIKIYYKDQRLAQRRVYPVDVITA